MLPPTPHGYNEVGVTTVKLAFICHIIFPYPRNFMYNNTKNKGWNHHSKLSIHFTFLPFPPIMLHIPPYGNPITTIWKLQLSTHILEVPNIYMVIIANFLNGTYRKMAVIGWFILSLVRLKNLMAWFDALRSSNLCPIIIKGQRLKAF